MKNKNKDIIIAFVILVLFTFFAFITYNNGFLSIIGQDDMEEIDTKISCNSDSDCENNNELKEISHVVYCENTCKFMREKYDGGVVNE